MVQVWRAVDGLILIEVKVGRDFETYQVWGQWRFRMEWDPDINNSNKLNVRRARHTPPC